MTPGTVVLGDTRLPVAPGRGARLGRGRLVEGLGARGGALHAGPWPEPVGRALLLPLALGTSGARDAVLVVGLSPRLPLEEGYRDFLQVLSRQLASDAVRVQALEQVSNVSLSTGQVHPPHEQVRCEPRRASPETGPRAFVHEAEQWLSPAPDASAHPPLPALPREAPRGHVLLADDNADMRDSLGRLLESRFTVEAVADGQAALAAARARPPDVVLSDVMMPGLEGFGLVRAFKADPRTAHVPLMLISARAGEEAKIEGLEAGVDDYLVKPFGARELLARVGAKVTVGQARAERERLFGEMEAARVRLDNLIENAPVFVCVLHGPEHVYALVNPLYQQLIGVGRELLGLPVASGPPGGGGAGLRPTARRRLPHGRALHRTRDAVPRGPERERPTGGVLRQLRPPAETRCARAGGGDRRLRLRGDG